VVVELQSVGDAVGGQRLHPVQDLVDVDRPAIWQGVVGEGFHPVHEPPDSVGLIDDELGERRVLGLGPGFQELGGAPDAGQRVLDLVGQHVAQADDGPQARLFGARALTAQRAALDVEGQQDRAVAERGRGPVRLEGRMAEEADLHAALPDADALLHSPVQQGDQGRSRRQRSTEPAAHQEPEALAEQGLCGLVHGHQGAGRIDDERRFGREIEGRGLQQF
jgi:hypothetical protein